MKQKILSILFIFILLLNFTLVVFATETEEVQTLTLTGADSNIYTFIPYNKDFDGNCYLYLNTENNTLGLYVFEKPVSITSESDYYWIFTTLDGSTNNTRQFIYCIYNSTLGYYNNWRTSSKYQFTDVTGRLSKSNLVYLGNFENTEPLKTLSEEIPPEESEDTNTNINNNISIDSNTNINTGDTLTNTTEINNNLSKIYEGIQFIVSFLSLGSVVLLIYIVYKFFLVFFTF